MRRNAIFAGFHRVGMIHDLCGRILKKRKLIRTKMIEIEIQKIIDSWTLAEGGPLQERLERMIRPALFAGHFVSGNTRYVSGLQYHLGGEQDTAELASIVKITANDSVLDICCYLGGPAFQLAESYGCTVTGIDLLEPAIVAANRMAELAGFDSLVSFKVADAKDLPFEDSTFSVVWNQCSLPHDEAWISEFSRVLRPGGRLAFTFQMAGREKLESDPFGRWRLQDAVALVTDLGFDVVHSEDISERDLKIGWMALDMRLMDHQNEFAAVLGADWVQEAHNDFMNCAEEMRSGKWGNGRIVAVKRGEKK